MKVQLGLLPRIIAAIILGVLLGSFMPEWFVKLMSTFNGLFGNFLNFAIPLIIIAFIAPGIGQLGKGAGKLLFLTSAIAYASTIIAGLLAFFTASSLLPNFISSQKLEAFENPEEFLLEPFFQVDMPPIMGVMTALVLAFILGIGMASIKGDVLNNVLNEFKEIVEKLISVIIIPLLPVHILGIFTNMTYGGQVRMILSVFSKVFIIIIALHIIMLLIQYIAAGALSKQNPFSLLKTMVPAYFTALGTQSSAATIPVTLRQVKKTNATDKVADFSVPLLATIHLSGSTITLVSCSIGVLLLNGESVTLNGMLPFIFMLGITMIAAPGVPGGGVVAALGLLHTMLGFNETMLALMIALYIAQDSFGTATNVTGDGAITKIIDRFVSKKKTVNG